VENVLVGELCQLNKTLLFYRVLDHHAHKPHCVLKEKIVG